MSKQIYRVGELGQMLRALPEDPVSIPHSCQSLIPVPGGLTSSLAFKGTVQYLVYRPVIHIKIKKKPCMCRAAIIKKAGTGSCYCSAVY